uniref:AT4g28360/F20O9_30 n=1 Tax=Arabidopsis thaliana TaxID=3702 RepID=Q940C1_ARATH|nr:AT4g28360/F20O9_30 [Arabidopsis thaliana]AAM47370.1 AT4g28360/F20O9_30 [Arabidopsis thaliana]
MGLVMRFDLYLMFVMLMGLGFTISNGYKSMLVGKMVGSRLLPKIILIGLTETGFKSTTLFILSTPREKIQCWR